MTVPNNANTYLPGTIAIPSSLLIVAISQSFPMVITISVDSITASNTYIVGQLVKLVVPRLYGMYQANGLVGQINLINGSNISVDIDSTYFDPFVIPVSTGAEVPASLSPAGSRNLEFNNLTKQVPFQSLNNTGN